MNKNSTTKQVRHYTQEQMFSLGEKSPRYVWRGDFMVPVYQTVAKRSKK